MVKKMYKVGDKIVYKRDVCKIDEIKENYAANQDYYVLTPLFDTDLKIKIPTNNLNLRNLITKKELEDIIDEIPNIDLIIKDNREIEYEYKNLLSTYNIKDLIPIIKTTYLRNLEREKQKKKISDIDSTYFELAEKYLYDECSVVLDKTVEETKEYFISKLKEVE